MLYQIAPLNPQDPSGACFLEFASRGEGYENVLRYPVHFDTVREAEQAVAPLVRASERLRHEQPSLWDWLGRFRNTERWMVDALRAGTIPHVLQAKY